MICASAVGARRAAAAGADADGAGADADGAVAGASAPPRRLGRIPALDGLRAVAVVLVIELHVGLVPGGYIGVDVFLALSGFLITALLYDEWERTGQISLARFMARRARRLLPALGVLLALFSAVMLALAPWETIWPLRRVLLSTVLMVNNWVCTLAPAHGASLGALSPTWTLAQEMQFYLLWPPILVAALSARARAATVLALLAVAIAALLAAEPILAHQIAGYNAYTSPPDRGAELLIGCAAAIVWRTRLAPRWLTSPLAGWLLCAAIGAIVWRCGVSTPVAYVGAAALAALLVINLATAAKPRERSWSPTPVAVLNMAPMRFVGRISYGIYLFHVPVYYLVWTYLPLGSRGAYGLVVPLLATGVAYLSWRLVEAPILRHRLGAARSHAPAIWRLWGLRRSHTPIRPPESRAAAR